MPGVNSKNIVYNSLNIDEELTRVNPVKALTSGKITSKDIGKAVYLSNSSINCQEWQIAGINYGGSGTIDLVSKYILTTSYNQFYGYKYEGSGLQSRMKSYHSGFSSDVQNASKTISIISQGITSLDKMVPPSVSQLSGGYPIFTTDQSRIRTDTYGNPETYWTCNISNGMVVVCDTAGTTNSQFNANLTSAHDVGIIRF